VKAAFAAWQVWALLSVTFAALHGGPDARTHFSKALTP